MQFPKRVLTSIKKTIKRPSLPDLYDLVTNLEDEVKRYDKKPNEQTLDNIKKLVQELLVWLKNKKQLNEEKGRILEEANYYYNQRTNSVNRDEEFFRERLTQISIKLKELKKDEVTIRENYKIILLLEEGQSMILDFLQNRQRLTLISFPFAEHELKWQKEKDIKLKKEIEEIEGYQKLETQEDWKNLKHHLFTLNVIEGISSRYPASHLEINLTFANKLLTQQKDNYLWYTDNSNSLIFGLKKAFDLLTEN
ncbi:hypothetical protein J4405_03475 [Candidatus Woesearchaeota archaeon]|nr:hypothetical protein [Candidatus Woesearchaeota archaeon]